MSLSKDLISQFVKATKDQTTVKKESTVYGTVVKYNDKTYVKIDGSDLLTPTESLSSVEDGERVSIMIKDHTATIIGNYTAPSASSIKVNGMEAELNANSANIRDLVSKNAEIENLVANKASISDLEAAKATIDTLIAKDAEIENLVADKANIGDLEAVNADIIKLKADKADIAHLEANYATIGSLDALYADITRLEADKANIGDLNAMNITVNDLKANKANITDLDATNANIQTLTSRVADINTLVNGNLTSDNIQSLHLTASNTTIDNALIKNAMIDSISANKINSGNINTNNVSIQSNDDSMILQGNLQQFKDENGKVRIQIGKDAQGNFTFVLYDENGTGQLINQNGIQSSDAIADGLIVDAKVAENANIAGSKLDINSVVTEINNGTTTIKGTKIYLDDKKQTLELAFSNLSTTVENLKIASGDVGDLVEKVSTNTTNIQVAQGQINTLISNTTITKENGETVQLKDDYSSTKQTVDSMSSKIGSIETTMKGTLKGSVTEYYVSTSNTSQTGGSWSTDSPTWSSGKYIWQRMKYTYTDGSTSYSTPVCIQGAKGEQGIQGVQGPQGIQGDKGDTGDTGPQGPIGETGPQGEKGDTGNTGPQGPQGEKGDTGPKGEKGDTGAQGPQGEKGDTGTKGDTGEKGQSLTKSTPQWYSSTSNTTQTGGSWVESMPALEQGKYIWLRYKLTWANPTATTYTTPTLEMIVESVKTVSSKQTSLEQNLEGFKTTVSNTYATQSSLTNVANNLKNNYSTTSDMNSAINQKANEITSSVSETYATKSSVTDLSKNLSSNYSTTTAINSAIDQKASSILSTVSSTYATQTTVNNLSNNLSKNYSTTSQMNTAINQKSDSILSTVSSTYATQESVSDLSTDLTSNYSTTTQMNSAIDQKASSILSTVSRTYATQDSVTTSISEVSQTANKINWLIKSGTSSANMILTDNALSIIANNINLTGKVTFSCLDSSTQGAINTANNNASTALSTANSAKSTADNVQTALNGNKDNWNNAFYRVLEWANGSIIGATTINGRMIETGTVLAEKIAIGDFNNYVSDPSFEKGIYTAENGWDILDGSYRTGTKCLRATSSVGPYGSFDISKPFNVRANDKIYVEWYQYRVSSTKQFNVDIQVYNNNGTNYAYDISGNYIPPASETISQWNKYSYVATPGVDGYCVVRVKNRENAQNDGSILFDDITVRKMTTGELIVDGSITADKISGKELVGVTLRNSTNTFSVDGDGNITGASIINSGGGNWAIDSEGNMETKNMSVEGELSVDSVTFNTLNNPNYPWALSGDIDLYVNSSTGNDDYSIDEILVSYDANEQNSSIAIKKFKTLSGVDSALPKQMNGRTIRIYLDTDDVGQVLFRNYVGGRILIHLCSHKITGYIGAYNCYSDFKIYGGSDQNKPSTYGVIKPSTNTIYNSDNSSIFLQKCPVCGVYYCDIYGGSTASGYHCVKVTEDCKCRIEECNFYSAYAFMTVSSVSEVFVNKTTGLAVDYAFKSYTGSIIHLANTAQANGKNGNAYWSNGSVIFGSLSQTIAGNYKITWDSNSTVTNNTTTTPAVTTKTITFTSTSGDTYRSTVYDNWKKDGTVRQGDYGYGDCNGCWFFGTQFADVKGKNITKVQITITRQAGGTSSAVSLAVKTHKYSSRPSGSPSYVGSVGSLSLATNTSGTLSITSTSNAIITGLKNGTIKGIGLQSSYTSALYAVCSGTCKIKVTYTE